MSLLPSPQMPLNNHSLGDFEKWFAEMGAQQSCEDRSKWLLSFSRWSVVIQMGKEDLKVTWCQSGKFITSAFPYGLSRADVEEAINAGPIQAF